MKANAIVRIVIYSLLIVTLFCIMVGVMCYGLYFHNGRLLLNDAPVPTESPIANNQLVFPTQIQNLDIAWVAGTVSIHPSDSLNNIVVEEYCPAGSEYTMICRQSGQTLKIEFYEEKVNLIESDHGVSKDLIIRVPRNWICNVLEIEAAVADVTLNDMVIQEFDFDGASGACRMNNCKIGELDMDTASGDIHFNGTLESLDCDAVSADCYIEVSNTPRSIKMDGLSGDLTLVLPEDAGFTCELNAMSGSFDTDFEFGIYNDHYICGNGDCHIKVSALSGDVSILKGLSNTQ